jgi:hypothetical protein
VYSAGRIATTEVAVAALLWGRWGWRAVVAYVLVATALGLAVQWQAERARTQRALLRTLSRRAEAGAKRAQEEAGR